MAPDQYTSLIQTMARLEEGVKQVHKNIEAEKQGRAEDRVLLHQMNAKLEQQNSVITGGLSPASGLIVRVGNLEKEEEKHRDFKNAVNRDRKAVKWLGSIGLTALLALIADFIKSFFK